MQRHFTKEEKRVIVGILEDIPAAIQRVPLFDERQSVRIIPDRTSFEEPKEIPVE